MATITKNQRLYVRTDADEKARIEHAAKLARLSVSDFIRIAVEDRTESVLAEEFSTALSPEAFESFLAALDTPPEPNAVLRRAARSERRFLQK
jgi:uncharacterized protein (DUF1778 family)